MSLRSLTRLAQVPSATKCFLPASARMFSTTKSASSGSTDLVLTDVDSATGYATLSMNRPKLANALSEDLVNGIIDGVEKLKADNSVKGIIVASTHPTVFSAGLDMTEFYPADKEKAGKFWTRFQELWFTLYSCPKPVAAAIAGHAPAGGCMIALTTDYRVMQHGKFNIGLNESKFGLVAPFYLRENYVATIGQRKAEHALMTGLMYSPQEALGMGLVDELAHTKEEVKVKCGQALDVLCSSMASPRAYVKLGLREQALTRFHQNREKDLEFFKEGVTQPEIQASIGKYLESLKNKAKK